MSGGIDSAAAVYFTKQLNIDISGATIRTGNFSCNGIADTESYISEARALASFFNIEHTTVDFSDVLTGEGADGLENGDSAEGNALEDLQDALPEEEDLGGVSFIDNN